MEVRSAGISGVIISGAITDTPDQTDLGNYERYLNVTLSRDNNITTGKIYCEVVNKEVGNCSRSWLSDHALGKRGSCVGRINIRM